MRKKRIVPGLVGLLVLGFLLSFESQEAGFTVAVKSQNLSVQSPDKEKIDRAIEILNLARQSIYGQTPKDKLKSLSMSISKRTVKGEDMTISESSDESDNSKKPPKKEPSENEEKDWNKIDSSTSETLEEFLFELPNKIKFSSTRKNLKSSVGTSFHTSTTLDGGNFRSETNIFVDGKPFDMNKIKLPGGLNLFNNTKSTDTDIAVKRDSFLNGFWLTVFPLLLDFPWSSSATFEYAGKAEADGTRADIIEVKSLEINKIQLFFDEKSHLLLMMTVKSEIVKDEGKSNRDYKYYFSNYESVDGILVAKKIIIDGLTKASINKSIMGYKMKGYNTTTHTEVTLKDIKVNPIFKANTFLIADEKK